MFHVSCYLSEILHCLPMTQFFVLYLVCYMILLKPSYI
jgi:hypothetical protein